MSNLRVRSFAILAILVGAAACADSAPTAPIAKAPLLRRDASSHTGGRPTRFANSVKYRDKGRKHGHGRAGNASLDVSALLGNDGRTTIDISTGEIGAANAPGALEKIELKLFALNGRLQTTTRYKDLSSPVFQVTVPGGVRGSRLEVKGYVVGIDRHRTDIVTVDDTVRLRPDLSVDRITAPAQARVSTPVTISALISENNGDVGARADCVLAVDGVEADRAHGIWVDAGRSVSCLFSHIFPTTGTKQLTVSAVSVNPGDWNTSNNTVAKPIDIILPPNQFDWSGRYGAVKDFTGTTFTEGYSTFSEFGSRHDWSILNVIHREDMSSAFIVASGPAMNGPVGFSFHDEVDGTLLNQVDFDPSADTSVVSDDDTDSMHSHLTCLVAYRTEPITMEGQDVLAAVATVAVCTRLLSGPGGPLPDISSTDITYIANAGDVSYYAEHWEKDDDGLGGGTTFTFNGETAFKYGKVLFGNDYSFAISLFGSDETKTASGTIHLSAPNTTTLSSPYTCLDFSDPSFFGFFQHQCSSANITQTLIEGTFP